MEIAYKNHHIQKVCTVAEVAKRSYGKAMAVKIFLRINQIRAADSVEFLVQYGIGRCHPLMGDRKGQFAMDLEHPYRLVFERIGEAVQIALISEIVDYH